MMNINGTPLVNTQGFLRPSRTMTASLQFGSRDLDRVTEAAAVRKQVTEAKAVQYAHASIPTYVYVTGRFSQKLAESFAGKEIQPSSHPEVAPLTGEDLLQFLTTPESVHPWRIPDPTQLSPTVLSLLGKSELECRAFAEQRGVPFYRIDDALTEGHRQGLIYVVRDTRRGTTYLGIPQEVRDALSLKPHQEQLQEIVALPKPNPVPVLTPLGAGISSFLKKTQTLPPHDEVFEYCGQLARTALKAGLIQQDDIPQAFGQYLVDDGSATESIPGSLLTLFESNFGTELAADTKALCYQAIDQGLLSEADFKEAKELLLTPA